MQTITELSQTTGLKVDFIRRSLKNLKPILKPYIIRGDKNSLLFKDGAIAIFNQVKNLKNDGYSLVSIKKELNDLLQNSSETVPEHDHNLANQVPNKKIKEPSSLDKPAPETQVILQMLRDKDEELKANRKVLEETQQKLSAVEGTVFLLTDGKNREEIIQQKNTLQKNKVRIGEILGILEGMEGKLFKGSQRKKLLQELKDLNQRVSWT